MWAPPWGSSGPPASAAVFQQPGPHHTARPPPRSQAPTMQPGPHPGAPPGPQPQQWSSFRRAPTTQPAVRPGLPCLPKWAWGSRTSSQSVNTVNILFRTVFASLKGSFQFSLSLSLCLAQQGVPVHTHTHTHVLTRQWSLSCCCVLGAPAPADTVAAFAAGADTLAPEILGKIPWESLPLPAWPLPELLFCSLKNNDLSQFPE